MDECATSKIISNRWTHQGFWRLVEGHRHSPGVWKWFCKGKNCCLPFFFFLALLCTQGLSILEVHIKGVTYANASGTSFDTSSSSFCLAGIHAACNFQWVINFHGCGFRWYCSPSVTNFDSVKIHSILWLVLVCCERKTLLMIASRTEW